MANLSIECNCPNPLCKKPYHFTIDTTGGERPALEGGTLVFRCTNPNCNAMIQAIFIGERRVEVKWLGEH